MKLVTHRVADLFYHCGDIKSIVLWKKALCSRSYLSPVRGRWVTLKNYR